VEPGDIISRTWALYRAHPAHLIGIAAVVFVPLGGIAAALSLVGWPGVVAGNVLGLAATFLVQGARVKAVEDVRDGRGDLGIAETYGHAGARLAPLAVAGVIAAVGIFIGLLLLVVPGLVLLTWWLVVPAVIMLEHRSVSDSFGRSRELVRGNAWPVFGVVVLTVLVLIALGLVIAIVLAPVDSDALRGFVGQAVADSLAAPFVAVAWTLTYFRLRELEERR
jgi:hypothetical protein